MKDNDIKTFCEELQTRMKEKLDVLALEESDVAVRCNKFIVLIAGLLGELSAFAKEYHFNSVQEEISFFKQQKPVLLSQYLYYQQVLSLKINEPPRVSGGIVAYYVQELEKLQGFFRDEAEFIQYCQSESTHFDDKYFVRGFIPVGDITTDRGFSTLYDERLSRVLANRLLKDYIISLAESNRASGDAMESSLTWTGSKADLIELIYGLETVGAINKGGADIKEIARRFESLFNINLGNFYRQFLDIRLRKKEKTTFLNQMKEKLEVRINDFS